MAIADLSKHERIELEATQTVGVDAGEAGDMPALVRCSSDISAGGFTESVISVHGTNEPVVASLSFPIVKEAPPRSNMEKEWMSILGRIEVLLLEDQDENGASVNCRIQIICLPSDSVVDVASAFTSSRSDSDFGDESLEDPNSSIFERISTFMGCCVSTTCLPDPPKSALRKRGDESSVARSVSFDKVELREFNMTLGDHPSAVTGPPIAIDWEKEARVSSISLDDYERSRNPRRHRRQLKMSMRTRCGILERQTNFSSHEITKAWEEALLVRKQRMETIEGGMWQMIKDDFWESANRKFKRMSNSATGMIG